MLRALGILMKSLMGNSLDSTVVGLRACAAQLLTQAVFKNLMHHFGKQRATPT